MKLQGSTVFITGGAGFVGSHIVDSLLKEKVKHITILDNFLRGTPVNLQHVSKDKRVQLINGDIRDIDLVSKLTKGCDFVVHQAAIRLTKCIEDPRLCHEVMVDGTFNVLEAAVKHHVKKIVMASSVSVYGEPSYVPIDEKHPYNNTTAYGAAKIANEHMAIAFHQMYKIPIIILRYFNVYGSRMEVSGPHTEVMIKWLDKLDKGEAPVIHGDGKQALDFIYVEDVAEANIKALESNIDFGIYNIGTGKKTSLKELAQILIRLMGAKTKPVLEPDVKRPNITQRVADTRRAEKELQFRTKISLEAGLKKLIVWRKERFKELSYGIKK